MRIAPKSFKLPIRVRIYFLTATLIVLCYYSFLNFTSSEDLFKAYVCIALAVPVLFQLFYIIRNGTCFLNHAVELFSFILLLVLTPVLGASPERGRMWLFVLPLVTFYTQGLNKGLIFIGIYLSLSTATYILSLHNFYVDEVFFFKERVIVFALILFITMLYERVLKKNQQTINRQLYFDSLTGLKNRRKLIEDLSLLKKDETIVLILINIDDFKEVNDLFGHMTGDAVILHLRNVLKDSLKSFSLSNLYKLPSDEFAVTLPESEKNNCTILLDRLDKKITETFFIGNDKISITASMGVSACSRHKPLEEADMALQKAKERKKHAVYFDSSLNTIEKYKSNRLILLALRKAVAENGFVPFFQPIFDNSLNKITRYESLARIVDHDIIYSPASFLDIAKRSKIYPEITRSMIKKTFCAFSENNYSFSINICRNDIFNPETVKLIYDELKKFNFPSRVIFELLETEKIEDCDEVHSFISRVKDFGCSIAVDDFGSGYSNFNYLLSLNADILKIDASLIKNIDKDFNSYTITKNIIHFAREMHIKTIAEHVHNQNVFTTIRRLNVDFAQGYYIGKPESVLLKTPDFERSINTTSKALMI